VRGQGCVRRQTVLVAKEVGGRPDGGGGDGGGVG
jgi:hypothetical protein